MTNEQLMNTVQQVLEYQDMLFRRFMHSLPAEAKKYVDGLVEQGHLSVDDSNAVLKTINDSHVLAATVMEMDNSLGGNKNEH